MTRAEIIALLGSRDPIAAADGIIAPPRTITWCRDAGEGEQVLRYGVGTTHDRVADRLLDLTGQDDLCAVRLVPEPDSDERPGSWGVEDMLVTAVARRVLPAHVAIRLDWDLLGAPACQVATAFGATEWVIPEGDDTDPDHLADAVGARAVRI